MWCADRWYENYKGAPTDGSAWLRGNNNRSPLRGGSWGDYPVLCRSAFRVNVIGRDDRYYVNGFRVVCGAGRSLHSESWQVEICREYAEEFSLFL